MLAVHTDKEHIHSHIIFNNTNLYSGLSFTTEHNQGKVKERAWAKLRQISDDICEKHGLSEIKEPEKGQGISHFEHEREKLLPVYKKYRNLSGWKQKRFRKRNASDIDDFEKTNAYVKRHIQDYDLPGNANKIIELQSLSIELKEKFNALISEHNAFLIRKAAAVQYIKVIRQYLHKKKMEESKGQSRDRTYNRQKDKQILE